MRISDWSSDVCSSDLPTAPPVRACLAEALPSLCRTIAKTTTAAREIAESIISPAKAGVALSPNMRSPGTNVPQMMNTPIAKPCSVATHQDRNATVQIHQARLRDAFNGFDSGGGEAILGP